MVALAGLVMCNSSRRRRLDRSPRLTFSGSLGQGPSEKRAMKRNARGPNSSLLLALYT